MQMRSRPHTHTTRDNDEGDTSEQTQQDGIEFVPNTTDSLGAEKRCYKIMMMMAKHTHTHR